MNSTCSPRVVGHNRADFYGVRTLLESPQFAGKSGEELALAIYNYFTSTVDGTYHFWTEFETRGNPRTRCSLSDPVKLLNCYGFMLCGTIARVLYVLYRAAGMPARVFGVPGHTLCEVFYGNRWHILDVDMWTWFRTPEGHIASAYELTQNPRGLILDNATRSNPCNLPDRTLEGYTDMYARAETVGDHVKCIQPHWAIDAHTMDFHLRPGETLIRSQRHQGRFILPAEWLENMKKFAGEWGKRHPRERYEPFRTFGNGRLMYKPDLTDRSRDFARGAWEASDLRQDASGLVGPGTAVFRVQSPYPFCGVPTAEGQTIRTADGVWLEVAGKGDVTVQVTDPDGRWVTAISAGGAFVQRADITHVMDARYDALVRLALASGARVKSFAFDGYTMVAPLSLPRLSEGRNPMQVHSGDQFELCTVPWNRVIDFRAEASLPQQWHAADNAQPAERMAGWQEVRPADAGRPVSLVFKFDAPAARPMAWFYALAAVREGPQDQPPRRATLEWSADARTWRPLAHVEISSTYVQWDVSLDGTVRPAQPVESIYLRVASGTAISMLEFYAHLLEPECPDQPGLRIVHQWQEGEQACEYRVPAGALGYVVNCGKEPSGHTVVMSVPSTRRAAE